MTPKALLSGLVLAAVVYGVIGVIWYGVSLII